MLAAGWRFESVLRRVVRKARGVGRVVDGGGCGILGEIMYS